MKRRNRQNSYERGGQVELAKAMGNVAKKGEKEINEGRDTIKGVRRDIENANKDITNYKRGIDEQKALIQKKEGYIKDLKKDLGGIYNTVQDAKKQKAKFGEGGFVPQIYLKHLQATYFPETGMIVEDDDPDEKYHIRNWVASGPREWADTMVSEDYEMLSKKEREEVENEIKYLEKQQDKMFGRGGKISNADGETKTKEEWIKEWEKWQEKSYGSDYYDVPKLVEHYDMQGELAEQVKNDLEISRSQAEELAEMIYEKHSEGGTKFKKGGNIDEAMFDMDKWLPEDDDAIREFQDIEDNGTEEDMIDYLNSMANEDVLYERYGLGSDSYPAIAKEIMGKSYAKGGIVRLEKLELTYNPKTGIITEDDDPDESYHIRNWVASGPRDWLNSVAVVDTDRRKYEREIMYLEDEQDKMFGKEASMKKGGEVKKKDNNEMIIGGLAGILLGIFLNK